MSEYNGESENIREEYEKAAMKQELEKLETAKKAKEEYDSIVLLDNKTRKILPKFFRINWVSDFKYLQNNPIMTMVVTNQTANIADANRIFYAKAHELNLKVKKINSIEYVGECFVDLNINVPDVFPDMLDKWSNDEK